MEFVCALSARNREPETSASTAAGPRNPCPKSATTTTSASGSLRPSSETSCCSTAAGSGASLKRLVSNILVSRKLFT